MTLPSCTDTGDDAIRCGLEVVSLDALPSYEALSYVWGDGVNLKRILVEGNDFGSQSTIAKNDGQSRRIWADAVCINQDDLREKERQIR